MEEGKSFDNTRDKKYSRLFHELLFSRESKNTKNLLAFSIGLLMTIGLYSLKDNIASFNRNVKELKQTAHTLHFSLTDLSIGIYKVTLVPQNLYFSLKEVSDFYTQELTNLYLTVGDYINSTIPKVSGRTITFLSNPSFYILENIKQLSLLESKFIDENLASIVKAFQTKDEVIKSSRQKVRGR